MNEANMENAAREVLTRLLSRVPSQREINVYNAMKFHKSIDGKIVGTLTVTKLVGIEWEIQYLKVDREHRGKHIATELLERAKEHAIKKGLMLVAFVDPEKDGSMNEQQIKIWLRNRGFKHSWYDFNEAGPRRSWFYHGTNNKRVMVFNEYER